MTKFIFILFLLVLTTIGYGATDIYLPSLPFMSADLNTSDTMVQFSIPIYMLSFALSPLFYGPYSDVIGRRKIIVIGLLVGLFSTFFIAVSNHIAVLLFCRFLQGAGLGAVTIAARAMIPDRFSGKEMASLNGLVNTFLPIMFTAAPVIGGVLQENFDWQIVFYVLFAYVGLTFLWVYFFLPETNKNLHHVDPKDYIKGYFPLFKNSIFLLYGLVPSFLMIGISAYITASPYLFQNLLGLAPSTYGFLALGIGSAVMIGGLVNTILLRYCKAYHLIFASVFMQLIATFYMGYIQYTGHLTPLTLVTASMIFFFSLNFAMGNAYAIAFHALTKGFGTATAFMGASQILIGAASSFLISLTSEENLYPLMSMFFLSCFFTFVVLFLKKVEE